MAAFVYGTLMAPEVVKVLIQRVPPMRPAVIKGFTRCRVKGVVFPAIVPDPHPEAAVKGQLLMDLSEAEFAALDRYEDVEYYRSTVTASTEDGDHVEANVYVWKDEFRHLLVHEAWDYDEWRANHLSKWMEDLSPDAAHPS